MQQLLVQMESIGFPGIDISFSLRRKRGKILSPGPIWKQRLAWPSTLMTSMSYLNSLENSIVKSFLFLFIVTSSTFLTSLFFSFFFFPLKHFQVSQSQHLPVRADTAELLEESCQTKEEILREKKRKNQKFSQEERKQKALNFI